MATGFAGSGRSTPEINVTPLIDVLLVLLIIFMIVLPHRELGEMTELPQPSTDQTEPHPEKIIVVQIRDMGPGQRPALSINTQDVSWDKLEATLRDIYILRMDKVAFLKGDPDVDFQFVADVVDTSHHAGVLRVGLMGAND